MKLIKLIFTVCIITTTSQLFCQTWEGETVDLENLWLIQSRIKKVSDGNYSYKVKITTMYMEEVAIGIGEIKRIEKRTDDKFKVSNGFTFKFEELCNYSLTVKREGKEVPLKGKCVLLHQNRFVEGQDKKLVENYGIIMFSWDEFDEKVDDSEGVHHKLIN